MTRATVKSSVPNVAVRTSTPSALNETSRERIVAALNERLAEGIDLHSQVKVAHWNVKGPGFPTLHPLFETFATALAQWNDELAERAVILGGTACGTTRIAARTSRLAELPLEVQRDVELAELLIARFDAFSEGLRDTRLMAEESGDIDTADLLTGILQQHEKHGWFLRATLGV
ncbi:MAG: DNA starvation/stationary phase protection protein Dps [Planctomycetaceae bacterium]|jgi:starvation-inducible DNA-binding protein|nr:DNA starvation/stationary phase protection protein Dps [Planctomycetaceae bacterium]